MRAHLERRRRRTPWTPVEVALVCALYFGGALALRQFGHGWMVLAWLALGGLVLLGQKRERAT